MGQKSVFCLKDLLSGLLRRIVIFGGTNWCLISLFFFGCLTPNPQEQLKPVPSAFQAWADENRNGMLESDEVDALVLAVQNLVAEPHVVLSPVDRFFDHNQDNRIDLLELEEARRLLFSKQLLKLSSVNPQFSLSIDFTSTGIVDEGDIEYVMEFLFRDMKKRWPHNSKNSADVKLDKNKDGFVDEREIENYIRYLYVSVSLVPINPENEIIREKVNKT
jgi:hypothetical protein